MILGDLAKRVGRSTAQLFVLRTVGLGLLFLMHTLMARRLGPAGYGLISYGLSVAAFAALVATLGLHNGVLRFGAQYLEAKKWGALKGVILRSCQIVLTSSLVASALVAAATLLMDAELPTRASVLYASWVLPLAALGLWRMMASRALGGIALAYLPEEVLLPSMVAVALLVLPAVDPSLALWIYLGAAFTATSLGMVWLVRFLPQEARRAKAEINTRLWLGVSLPMTVASVTQLGMTRADALLIGSLTSIEETGRYLAAVRIAMLVALTLRIVDTAVAPMMSAAFHSGRLRDLRSIFGLGIGLSALGGLPVFLFGIWRPDLLLRLFGGGYLEAEPVLRVLLTGQMINAATGPIAFLLLMTGYEKVYARAMGMTALLSVVAHSLIIPVWGGWGAAWVTSVATAVLNLGLLAFGFRSVLRRKEPTDAP